MKKSIIFIIIALTLLTACSKKSDDNVEGDLTDIMAALNEAAGIEFPVYDSEVTADNIASFVGTDEVTFTEALASDPMMSAIPHSVVLLRVDEKDVESTKNLIRENADPRKWICVGVEPDQVKVESRGNLIILVMSASCNEYIDAFNDL